MKLLTKYNMELINAEKVVLSKRQHGVVDRAHQVDNLGVRTTLTTDQERAFYLILLFSYVRSPDFSEVQYLHLSQLGK